ncbi:MAG: lysophospholipid acyltransferase family protein [Pseudolabrys sp.]
MARTLFIAAFFFTMTPLVIAAQWLLSKLRVPGWGLIASSYYQVLCALLRINVRIVGKPAREQAVFYVCNHVSWADILVLGSLAPVAFVAKREVRDWPLVGKTAELQRTVFVDRQRRHKTGDAVDQIVDRLAQGISVILFAEGTSSDGNRVLPFRSALLGSVEDKAAHGGPAGQILIQPMAIAYTSSHGIPMGRQHRPLVAWYGDLDFLPHIKDFIRKGAIEAVVSYGEAVPADAGLDRKALTKRLENETRRLMAESLLGRPLQPAGPDPELQAAAE